MRRVLLFFEPFSLAHRFKDMRCRIRNGKGNEPMKKLICLLLSLMMVLMLCPLSVLADEGTDTPAPAADVDPSVDDAAVPELPEQPQQPEQTEQPEQPEQHRYFHKEHL